MSFLPFVLRILPALVLSLSLPAVAAPVLLPDAAFEAYVQDVMKATRAPGVAIAVVDRTGLVYAKGFGTRNIETGEPVTSNTLFAIGSTTKAMTAMTAAMLVDAGKARWDQPVRDILPDFELSDPVATSRSTLVELMSHTTGLPRHDLTWYGSSRTEDQLFVGLKHLQLTAPFGTAYQYNNLMFMVAGRAMGKAASSDWHSLVRRSLFAPLGMTGSTTRLAEFVAATEASAAHEIQPAGAVRIAYRSADAVAAAGSVGSSLRDMSLWLELLLGGGEFRGQRLVSRASFDEVFKRRIRAHDKVPTMELAETHYGLGWMLTELAGNRWYLHGGGIDGFLTHVSFMPDLGVGVVILSNSFAFDPEVLGFDLYDHLLGRATKKYAMPRAPSGPTPPPGTHPFVAPTRDLREFEGDYEHPAYGLVKVSLKAADTLQVRFNIFDFEIKPVSDTKFALPDVPPGRSMSIVEFGLDPVTGLSSSFYWKLEPSADPIRFVKR